MVSDNDLIQRLESLQSSINNVRADLSEEGRKRDIRIRTNRVLTLVAVIVGCVGIVVGGAGIYQINRANTARCESGNDFRKADRARWEYIIDLSPPPTTQEAQERLDKFKGYIATADALRKC